MRKNKISSLYEKILNRKPDKIGLNQYVSSSLSLDEIENDLLNSNEYSSLVTSSYNQNFPLLKVPKRFDESQDWKPSSTVNFYDLDNKQLYLENCNQLGKDWVWFDTPIEYSFNSHGYRMKEFCDIDYDNYIAVLGCSFSFGLGLPLEETFAYKISRELNCDLVNAAITGSSNKSIVQNLFRVLAFEKRPKQVIINWTYIGRNSYWEHPAAINLNFPSDENKSLEYSSYYQNRQYWAYDFLEQRYLAKVMCELSSVKLIELTMFGGVEDICPDLKTVNVDWCSKNKTLQDCNKLYARDLTVNSSHPGVMYQQMVVDYWKRCNDT